jgi:two-component system, OmpR family, response regulator
MSTAATILLAREDLSIPGAVDDATSIGEQAGSVQARFFELVSRNRPDVIVLDFSSAPARGKDTVLSIRQRTDIPIVVVCGTEQPVTDDYRIAGAADCIPSPVNIIRLNETIQRIMRVRGCGRPVESRPPQNFLFARISFDPRRNLLAGEEGSTVELTSSEGRLMAHFLAKPWTLCTRSEIGELLYGPEQNVGDRAIDATVNRLRKKLVSAGGPDAEQLIKTKFRRGYLLATDVATPPREVVRLHPALEAAS